MKCQDLFSLEKKKKMFAAVVIGALRVKATIHLVDFLKWGLFYMERIRKFFPFRVDHFSEGSRTRLTTLKIYSLKRS